MIPFKKIIQIALTAFLLTIALPSFAGNEDRVGQAGASELLINPWARSAGWAGANSAFAKGVEASFTNVAGTAFTEKTELAFTHSFWLKGSDISINSLGLNQKFGESSVIGVNLVSMSFGDIPVTTNDQPEGNGSKFSPRMMNIGLSYAKAFSSSIYGGINVKMITENISNASAQGIALDAGIQYVTGIGSRNGKKNTDNLKFGIALKNVGPPVHFSGDGLSIKGTVLSSGSTITLQQRSEHFELPSLVNIGAGYDLHPSDEIRITLAGTFTSNSFSKDAYQLGGEFAYMNYFAVRFGYYTEQKAKSTALESITTWYTGPSGGVSLNVPFSKESKKSIAIDYSIRFTRILDNVSSIGARLIF